MSGEANPGQRDITDMLEDISRLLDRLLEEMTGLRRRVAEVEREEKVRHKVENVPHDLQERYEALFDRSLFCVYVHDFEGRLLDANQETLALLGFEREEVPSLTLDMLLGEDQLPRLREALEEIRGTGSQSKFDQWRLRRKDGTFVWVEARGSLIYDHGNPCAVLTLARDISRRKDLEQERKTLIAELEEALTRVKMLSGLLPICSACKKIRDDEGYWHQVESYLRQKCFGVEFSHGICPDCLKKLYPEYCERVLGAPPKLETE